jgi:AraC family transcriptional regulator of adaptative response/methylated-DNA-[protein]-cysteine methyltransferase
MDITFGIEKSPFGIILGGESQKGLCFIGIGHHEEKLAAELFAHFPTGIIKRNDDQLKPSLQVLVGNLNNKPCDKKLLLDIHGTLFQRTVWKSLIMIPSGETRSYSELADRIGNPRACRAVGSACGKNPLALVFPCHRVVGKNGDLTGFRWGKTIKQALLNSERIVSSLTVNANWINKQSFS